MCSSYRRKRSTKVEHISLLGRYLCCIKCCSNTDGMDVKSLTNSRRKIIDILNKYGHRCSHYALEELETAAMFVSTLETDIRQKRSPKITNIFYIFSIRKSIHGTLHFIAINN